MIESIHNEAVNKIFFKDFYYSKMITVDTNTLGKWSVLFLFTKKEKKKKERRLKVLVRQGTDLLSKAMYLMLTRLLSLHESLDPQIRLR